MMNSITENMFGGYLTAWAQYAEGQSVGMASRSFVFGAS
jgi:hypothetical protein